MKLYDNYGNELKNQWTMQGRDANGNAVWQYADANAQAQRGGWAQDQYGTAFAIGRDGIMLRGGGVTPTYHEGYVVNSDGSRGISEWEDRDNRYRQAQIEANQARKDKLNAQFADYRNDVNQQYRQLAKDAYQEMVAAEYGQKQQLRALGLTGGASESSALALRQDYANALAQQGQQRAQVLADLEAQRRQALYNADYDALQAEQAYQQRMLELANNNQQYYDSLGLQQRQQTEQEKQHAIANAYQQQAMDWDQYVDRINLEQNQQKLDQDQWYKQSNLQQAASQYATDQRTKHNQAIVDTIIEMVKLGKTDDEINVVLAQYGCKIVDRKIVPLQ